MHPSSILEVEFPQPRAYSSAARAIDEAKNANAEYFRQSSLACVLGEQVDSIACDNRAVVFRFAGGRSPTVQVEEAGCTPSVAIGNAAADKAPVRPIEAVVLKTGSLVWEWNREEICGLLRGTRLTNAFYNGDELYLYFSSGSIVSFAGMLSRKTNTVLLYWDFSE